MPDLTAADCEGDGNVADLTVAIPGRTTPDTLGNVAVLSNNGDGTFAPARNVTAGRSPSTVTSADFDRDGKEDLAVENGSNVSISLSNGNASGFSNSRTAVVDKTPPRGAANTPAANAQNVARASNVTATFLEAMDQSTINSATFTLKRGAAKIGAVVAYNATLRRATLNPKAVLVSKATYTVTVTTGAKDVAGNVLDQAPATTGDQVKTWRFKVR